MQHGIDREDILPSLGDTGFEALSCGEESGSAWRASGDEGRPKMLARAGRLFRARRMLVLQLLLEASFGEVGCAASCRERELALAEGRIPLGRSASSCAANPTDEDRQMLGII